MSFEYEPASEPLHSEIRLVVGGQVGNPPELSDTKVYEPQIRARLGTTAHLCKVVVLKLRTVPI